MFAVRMIQKSGTSTTSTQQDEIAYVSQWPQKALYYVGGVPRAGQFMEILA